MGRFKFDDHGTLVHSGSIDLDLDGRTAKSQHTPQTSIDTYLKCTRCFMAGRVQHVDEVTVGVVHSPLPALGET